MLVVVMGAGTGRIAGRLAMNGRVVIAVDRSHARLKRITPTNAIHALVADFCKLPISVQVDDILFPYSTLQLLSPGEQLHGALTEARRLCSNEGRLWIDLSDNFYGRPFSGWHSILCEFCEELGVVVTEDQKSIRHVDHLELVTRFTVGNLTTTTTTERWYWHSHAALVRQLKDAGFRVCFLRRGYGGASFLHKRIYMAIPDNNESSPVQCR